MFKNIYLIFNIPIGKLTHTDRVLSLNWDSNLRLDDLKPYILATRPTRRIIFYIINNTNACANYDVQMMSNLYIF